MSTLGIGLAMLPAQKRVRLAPPIPGRGSQTLVRDVNAQSYVARILARPVFSITRRPPATASDIAPGISSLPRLSGIYIAGGLRRAIFEDGRKPRVSAIGDHIGAYRIQGITPVSVTLEGPDGPRVVNPGFDPSSIGGHPVAASPMPPSILDRLNFGPPRKFAVPRPPSMTQMLSRLPQGHPP